MNLITPPLPPADADGDGLLDKWETIHGLSIASGTGSDGPDGDPDGDRANNFHEFAFGGDPRAASDRGPSLGTVVEISGERYFSIYLRRTQWRCLRWQRAAHRILGRCGLRDNRIQGTLRRPTWNWPWSFPRSMGAFRPRPPDTLTTRSDLRIRSAPQPRVSSERRPLPLRRPPPESPLTYKNHKTTKNETNLPTQTDPVGDCQFRHCQ